jgi:hypothetical protein
MFEPYLYTEGFRLARKQYVVPEKNVDLPAAQKRSVTICNLFVNQHKSIDEIAKLLDTNRQAVVSVLIHEGLILDRRSLNQAARNLEIERRQPAKYHLSLVLPTGETEQFRALCGEFGSGTVSEFVFNEMLSSEQRCEECQKRFAAGK